MSSSLREQLLRLRCFSLRSQRAATMVIEVGKYQSERECVPGTDHLYPGLAGGGLLRRGCFEFGMLLVLPRSAWLRVIFVCHRAQGVVEWSAASIFNGVRQRGGRRGLDLGVGGDGRGAPMVTWVFFRIARSQAVEAIPHHLLRWVLCDLRGHGVVGNVVRRR